MYDILIIGCGIAGMTAGIYGARANKKVVIFESTAFGGQILNAKDVENYPGYEHTNGFELSKKIYDQVVALGVEVKYETVVSLIDKNTVQTNKGIYKTKTIIIANGLNQRALGLTHETDLVGKGISYCATCDGNFYKGKDVAVIGGGNVAMTDVLYLSNIVNKVHLIHRRDEFKADPMYVDKVKKLSNVELHMNNNVKELIGENKLTGIILTDDTKLDIDCLFVAIGQKPDNLAFSNLVKMNSNGFIESSDTTTNVDNIFVAGDTRTTPLRQLVTAASDGAVAAMNAIKYLK